MKKQNTPKLSLKTETVKSLSTLSTVALQQVAGAGLPTSTFRSLERC